MRNLIFISLVLIAGCAPHTATFMSPTGRGGDAIIQGCHQIPSTFRYEIDGSEFRINLGSNAVYLAIEAVDGSVVEWQNNEITILINNKKYTEKVKDFIRTERVREPCGGLTASLNCKVYRTYSTKIDFESIVDATEVRISPPVPMVNKTPFNVSEIEYKKVTKTLMQAINC
ncbi:MAG: hypothetical protein E6Q75_04800 [Rheinheimera sp.]|nr:MAG: hypothetical protein E6Q75_04800 [Rheinheimera sp.]